VKTQHAYETEAVPLAIENPAQYLYSETNSRIGGQLDTTLSDLRDQVIQGRKTLSDWDAGVKDWRRSGGDKIRQEYQEALQKKPS
jgi:putative aldouronate transport system substrate-binding protein